jgi:CXXX repeat peptide maturase
LQGGRKCNGWYAGLTVAASIAHLLVLLEEGATSFCTYENPLFYSPAEPRWISAGLLRSVTALAERNAVSLTFLFGKTKPPAALVDLIEAVPHVKIVPLALEPAYPDAIIAVDGDQPFENLRDNHERNLILRLTKPKGASLAVEKLMAKFRRLSLHFTELAYFGPDDYADHTDELSRIAKLMERHYRNGGGPEVNLLSDRMMLKDMRNCGAGCDHLTLAPNGKLYICPGFYHDDPAAFAAVFDAKTLPARIETTELHHAPLCSRCDAFHCKRCIFLNGVTTGELNVPSEQQCAVAHIEREASRKLLSELGSVEPFRRMERISELNYRDPLEIIDLPPRERAR